MLAVHDESFAKSCYITTNSMLNEIVSNLSSYSITSTTINIDIIIIDNISDSSSGHTSYNDKY